MGPLFLGHLFGKPIGLIGLIGLSLSLTPPMPAAALLSLRGGPRADARRYDRWGQALEVTFGEVMPGGEPPLRRARAAACHKPIPPCSALQPEAMRLKADCAEPLEQRCCAHQPRRRPTWTTRHPARFKKHADCRPLLQQFLPIRGRVVQPGNRAAFPHAAQLVRLTDRHSSRTATGALRRTIRPTPGMHGPRCQRQQLLSTAIGMFLARAPKVFLRGFSVCTGCELKSIQ